MLAAGDRQVGSPTSMRRSTCSRRPADSAAHRRPGRATCRPFATTTWCFAPVRPAPARPTWPWPWPWRRSSRRSIRKIVLVRPAVEAGESLGFLPGDLQAKINPYLRPLLDALREMMDYDQIKRYTEEDVIEVIPLAYMRGRTLNEAFIILDEAQNTTVSQMKMFLTRMGTGSKIVVSGDTTQVDLPPHTAQRPDRRHRTGCAASRAIATVTLDNDRHRAPSAWCRRSCAPTRKISRESGAKQASRPCHVDRPVKNEHASSAWPRSNCRRASGNGRGRICAAATCSCAHRPGAAGRRCHCGS